MSEPTIRTDLEPQSRDRCADCLHLEPSRHPKGECARHGEPVKDWRTARCDEHRPIPF